MGYCTPYTTDIDYLGASPNSACVDNDPNGCTPNPSTTFPSTFVLRQCNAGGPHTIQASFLDLRTLFVTGQAASTVYRNDGSVARVHRYR